MAMAVALVSIGAVIIGHFALFGLARVRRRALALVALFVAGSLGTGLWCSALGIDGWRTLCAVALLPCAFILYMPLYYTVSKSFSARMLRDLSRDPGGLARDALAARYPTRDIVVGRLETLAASGYLRQDGDRLVLTSKGRFTARAFALVKRGWGLGPGG
jgi:hypothetical protein